MRDGRQYCRHELTFTGLSPEEFGELYRERLKLWGIDKVQTIAAQPEIFPKTDASGETVSESLFRAKVPIRKGDPNRVAGWSRLRTWLQPVKREDTPRLSPSLLFHPDCVYTIRTLPTLIQDESDPDDLGKCVEEYPARALALWAMARPSPQAAPKKPPPGPGTWAYELELNRGQKRDILGADLVEKR